MTSSHGATPAAPFLSQLRPEVREQLLERSERRHLSAGATLIRLADLADSIYVVISGLLGVAVPVHGRLTEVARHGPGELCGEMSFLLGERAGAHVSALAATDVWRIPHSAVRDAAADDPTVMTALASCVAERLNFANLRLREEGAGYSIGVISAPHSDWAIQVLARAASRAADFLRRPALLIDLDEAGDSPPWASSAPASMLTAVRNGSALPDPAETGAALTCVTRGSEEDFDPGWLAQTVAGWCEAFGIVVVRAGDARMLGSRLFADLGATLVLLEEDAGIADIELRDQKALYLRRAPGRGTPGECSALSRTRAGPVLHVIPGGPDALVTDPMPPETQAAIDWTGRHLVERKVGLALGSGGSKGYAHLGIVRELRRLGVPLDYIAGCSVGAPIAAGVAAGWDLDLLRQKFDEISRNAVRLTLPRKSLLSSKPLHRDINALAQGRQFEELEIPLALVAVDVQSREEIVMTKGDVAQAIFASFAIPGFYEPVELDGRRLVDGALLNPIPIETVLDLGADIAIGVRLTNSVDPLATRPRRRRFLSAPPIVETFFQTIETMQWKIAEEATRAHVNLEPQFEGPTGLRDFDRGDDFEEAGRRATVAARSQLEELLPWIGGGHG